MYSTKYFVFSRSFPIMFHDQDVTTAPSSPVLWVYPGQIKLILRLVWLQLDQHHTHPWWLWQPLLDRWQFPHLLSQSRRNGKIFESTLRKQCGWNNMLCCEILQVGHGVYDGKQFVHLGMQYMLCDTGSFLRLVLDQSVSHKGFKFSHNIPSYLLVIIGIIINSCDLSEIVNFEIRCLISQYDQSPVFIHQSSHQIWA